MDILNLQHYTDLGIEYKVNETPSFLFYTFSFYVNNRYIEMTIRNYSKSEEEGLFELINFIKGKDIIKSDFNKVSNIKFNNLEFNALLVYKKKFENPIEIDINKFTAFPIYECEFTGNENSEELCFIRRNLVTTIDWKRIPSPIVKMKFSNLSTGIKSTGKKLSYFSKSDFFDQLKSLRKTDSFIEVRNYKNDLCKMTVKGNKILFAENEKESKFLTKIELKEYFNDFFD